MYLLKSRSENTNSKYFITFKRSERFITLEGGKAVPLLQFMSHCI